MHVKSLRVKNYRSFKDEQVLEFGARNIFIGKNGSGKSNLLSAISRAFLPEENKTRPQYNDSEDESLIEVVVSNPGRMQELPAIFTITVKFKEHPEYLIDGKTVTREHLATLSESLGVTAECLVKQGAITAIGEMDEREKYDLFLKMVGVKQYEERKEEALKLLDEQNDEHLNNLLLRLQNKVSEMEVQRERIAELEEVKRRKAEAEYDVVKWELYDLNSEIKRLEDGSEKKEIRNEALLEFELKECREALCALITEEAELDRQIACCGSFSEPGLRRVAMRTEKMKGLRDLEKERDELQIETAALRYFEAMGTKTEPVELLIRRLESVERQLGDPKCTGNLTAAIEERKELWIRERRAKEELEAAKRKEKKMSEKLFCLGNEAVAVYDSIKNEPGVIGPIHSLLSVPESVADAFEAVARSKLFWILVEDEDVAIRLVDAVNGKATFVALNRMTRESKGVIEDPRMIKLSKAVKSEKNVRGVVEYICRDFYLTTDLKSAVDLSTKYNANVVTTEGDIASRNGLITGGFEQPCTVLRELKESRGQVTKWEEELEKVKGDLKRVSDLIELLERENQGSESEKSELELKAMKKAIEWKIELIRTKKLRLREAESVAVEVKRVDGRINQLRNEVGAIERQGSAGELERYEAVGKMLSRKTEVTAAIEELRKKETQLVDSLFGCDELVGGENDSNMQRRHILIDKRSQLLQKVGDIDHGKRPERSREELLDAIKKLSLEVRRYAGCERAVHLAEEGRVLQGRIGELREGRAGVLDFIGHMEEKKDEWLSTSLMIASCAYKEYYSRVTGEDSELIFGDGKITVTISGSAVDPVALSGGQKTVVALCFIFALQSVTHSSFYLFDEIDANLDPRYRSTVYSLIRESPAQYFITTFKEDALFCADKFYGVVVDNKMSRVGEIDLNLAREMLNVSLAE